MDQQRRQSVNQKIDPGFFLPKEKTSAVRPDRPSFNLSYFGFNCFGFLFISLFISALYAILFLFISLFCSSVILFYLCTCISVVKFVVPTNILFLASWRVSFVCRLKQTRQILTKNYQLEFDNTEVNLSML